MPSTIEPWHTVPSVQGGENPLKTGSHAVIHSSCNMKFFYLKINKSKTWAMWLSTPFHVHILSINPKRPSNSLHNKLGAQVSSKPRCNHTWRSQSEENSIRACGYEYEYRDREHVLRNKECVKSADKRCTMVGGATPYGKIVMLSPLLPWQQKTAAFLCDLCILTISRCTEIYGQRLFTFTSNCTQTLQIG